MDNRSVSLLLNEIADILEIQGSNPFRIRSYRRTAETLEGLSRPVEDIAQTEGLQSIAGIGKDLDEKIRKIIATGTCPTLEKLRCDVPPSTRKLLKIHEIGPRAVKLFMERLNVRTIDDLEQAAEAGKIKELPRMGARLEQKILKGIGEYKRFQGRYYLGHAYQAAHKILDHLTAAPDRAVISSSMAGSLRRWRETIGDIDLLVASKDPDAVMDRLGTFTEIEEILLRGPTKMSVLTIRGMQVDLRVVEPASYGAARHYFTGSKQHNIRIRERAQKIGLKVNEYGVFREADDERLCGDTEEEIFSALELAWIPPEMREDRGEIEAAAKGMIPCLITAGDIKGDLHVHSTRSDGVDDMKTMALAARELGYEYIAITDHTKSTRIAGGQDETAIIEQIKEVEALNRELHSHGITVLAGAEVDILPDGTLDIADEVLERLDVVIGSVHSRFSMTEEDMTRRIIQALKNPYLHLLAHPSGRLIMKREPYAVNMEAVIAAAAEYGKGMEINSHHERLDLKDVHARRAVEQGVKIAVCTDAHSTEGFNYMVYGIGTARRGWLTKENVVNTWSLNELMAWLKRRC